ncbi:MAG: putative phosphoesterase [Planctomycetota bacterium]|nr:putative phosphoesterase [Planctomycetota bacterium]
MTSVSAPGLLSPPELSGWSLAPEGAAVHLAEGTAVIADVHLGYEWARGSRGDCIPPHSLRETVSKLETLLSRVSITRLIIAGDLVESAGPCARTANDVASLFSWLKARGVEAVWIRGNHDPARGQPTACELDGWRISHGDRGLGEGKSMIGHHHPALKTAGLSAPCFLVGHETIVLPAFSPNSAGLDVGTGRLPRPLHREPLRCVAGLGEELLDFGPIAALAAKLL